MRLSYSKTLYFALIAILMLVSISTASAADNPFVGKWGYTILLKSISPSTWYGTWKNEVGTITFNTDGTAVATYKESAQICPDSNHCKTSDTTGHTYVVNADGSATLDGALKLVMSADGKVAIGDGTFNSSELLFFAAVKMDAAKTYFNIDIAGQYYGVSYEHDMTGGEKGYYRAETTVSSMTAGTYVNVLRNGNLNGDGAIISINNDAIMFTVAPDGTIDANGMITGYAGYGNVTVFSNARGGATNDFMSVVSMKKQDRSYTQADLSGTWTIGTFSDNAGSEFHAGFGTLACDSAGTCTALLKERKSDGTIIEANHTLPVLTVSNDGSINGFYFTNNMPHFAGAIGNDGKTLLLAMNTNDITTNDRTVAVAVKNAATSTATVSFSGKVQDPSGNYVSGIKVEVAGNSSIPAVYTNTNGEYTVTGIPSGQDFTLRFTMSGALPTYTPTYNITENTTISTYFRLYADGWNTSMGNTANMGIIHGRIRESGTNWETSFISGATITPSNGAAEYSPDQTNFYTTSTFGNGQWFVRNVEPGTVVTVAGTKSGTTMPSRKYMVFADGVTSGSLFATPDAGTIWVTSILKDASNGNFAGNATVSLVSDGTKTTTTKGDGSFTLTRIPSNTQFALKFSKTGYVDTYLDRAASSEIIPSFTRSAMIFPTSVYTGWNIEAGKGFIYGGVRDGANPSTLNLAGAVVDAGAYTVIYKDVNGTSGTSTFSNGLFLVVVDDNATVTLNGSKAGYTFTTNTVTAHAGAVTLAALTGTASAINQTEVQHGFQAAIDAYNLKSENFLDVYVSQGYLDGGENYNTFAANTRSDWSSSSFQTRTYTVNGTTITGADTATMNITWMNGETDTIYLKKEGNTWKLYGDQKLYGVDFYGFHNDRNWDGSISGKYHAGFNIYDPYGVVSSATVTGTGIPLGTPTIFVKNGENWWPENQVDFGTTQPSNATYIVTVNDASGAHTYNGTVNGGVADFASNLAPTGSITGSFNFTFTGITGADCYGVDLFDASWNKLWSSSFEGTSTTIPYNGPALSSGAYNYQVQSRIGDNASVTWQQFNYTGSAAATISYTGKVVDFFGNGIAGAVIAQAADSGVQTTSGTDGSFVLTGLPSGTVFSLRITKDGFIPVFSANYQTTNNITALRPYKLFTAEQTATWGIEPGKGQINGVVADESNSLSGTLSGATLTATGSGGKSYPVTYETEGGLFGGTATSANGRYYVLNVDNGDVVTVSVSLPGYTFEQSQRTFVAHGYAMNEGSFFGSQSVSEGRNLVPGWNFISFPKLPTDKSVTTVLADILAKVKVVWGYDNVGKAWKKYKPGEDGNTLSTIDSGKGYWIYMNASGTIDTSAWSAQSATVTLAEGWNLIGYNGTDDISATTALDGISGKWSVVWNWKNDLWTATPETGTLLIPVLDKFKTGRAYWIKIKTGSATDWVQP